MEQDCIFCKIISGNITSQIIYQDGEIMVIRDINPKAPTHLLLIPKTHIATLNDLTPAQNALAGHLIQTAIKMANKEGIASKGYRLIINCGREGGQEVDHLHLHVLGGRKLSGSLG